MFEGYPSGTPNAPCQRPRHRFAGARVKSFLMYRHALWRVNAYEHLRTAGTRQSHLDVDEGSVVKGLVMSAMMERW